MTDTGLVRRTIKKIGKLEIELEVRFVSPETAEISLI